MKLKRFSEAKQEQLEQLVSYSKLLGLTGRDLVAIGGKIDREEKKERKNANMEIIKSFECLPIGKDTTRNLSTRFKLRTINGAYNFELSPYYAEVTSVKSKNKMVFHTDPWEYDLPKTEWRDRIRYAILLEIASGKIVLNF